MRTRRLIDGCEHIFGPFSPLQYFSPNLIYFEYVKKNCKTVHIRGIKGDLLVSIVGIRKPEPSKHANTIILC